MFLSIRLFEIFKKDIIIPILENRDNITWIKVL